MDVFFRIDDEGSATGALQRRLRVLSDSDGRIPYVFIDGIYGEETVEAVRAFQEIYGLPITGETDFATHRSIGEAYKKRLRELERRPGSPDFDRLEGGVISPGDRFDGVTALQLLFNSVAEQDDRFAVEISGVYGDSTLVAVKLFDALRGRDGDGKVDRVFWNELQDFSSRFSEN
ncbi:MAG: peptidoglycan-binding protein [Clostridia bacterium]|nr:peptidoglycan-binding protein [Clostridia bacterium]